MNVTDVYARGVNVNLTPLTSNRGALATDARGCSLWRYLLERPPPTWESRVRDPLGTRYEFGRCGPGRGCYMYTIRALYQNIHSKECLFTLSANSPLCWQRLFALTPPTNMQLGQSTLKITIWQTSVSVA